MRAPQLGEADKRAVDMLLDQLPQSRAAAVAGFTAPAKSVVEPERLDAARGVLALLDHWEAPEPPADLVARTLARVQQAPIGATADQPGSAATARNVLHAPGRSDA